MQANHIMEYDVDKSSARIDEILNVSNQEFIEKDSIPSRDTLTYKNGCYVNVTCLFIDIIGSSDMLISIKDQRLLKYIDVLYLNVLLLLIHMIFVRKLT